MPPIRIPLKFRIIFKICLNIAYSIYGPTTRGRIVTKDGLEVISYFAPSKTTLLTIFYRSTIIIILR